MKLLGRKLDSSAAAHGHEDHVHVMPLPMYFGVFAALLVLTVVTVGVSVIGLPPFLSIVVAIAVATVKATLVVLYFMHLRYENLFYSFIFVSSLFFVLLFFLFTLGDTAFRGFVIPEQDTAVWRNEQVILKREAAAKAASESPAGGAPAAQTPAPAN
jgi:cytochrome c oxidase subunit 4